MFSRHILAFAICFSAAFWVLIGIKVVEIVRFYL
jgi:hypothetical protein